MVDGIKFVLAVLGEPEPVESEIYGAILGG